MPGVTETVNKAVAYYSVAGSAGNLPCAYPFNNAEANIGIAWIVTDDSTTASSVTDSNGNTWVPMPPHTSNIGNSQFYVCASLKPGANTVTAHGLTSYTTGSPELIITEWEPPPCPTGTTGIQMWIPQPGGDHTYPQLQYTSQYKASQGTFYHTLVAAIKCGDASSSATARTWAMTPDGHQIAFNVVIQYNEPSGTATGALAYCTVPYPFTDNQIIFTFTPPSPPINAGETKIIGLLFNTIA